VSTAQPLPLSRDRILACAVEVADRDGLDAASLRRVATELGVHVTSLYNHVPTKEALLDGVVEELLAGAGLPVGELSWEQWVRQYAAAMDRLAQAHPGAFAVLMRRPVQGPRAAATFEAGMQAFSRAGMEVAEVVAALKGVVVAVLGCCVEKAYLAAGGDLTTDVTALPWQEFPQMHRGFEVADEVDILGALTEVLVAGLAQRMPGRRRTSVRGRTAAR
jgi:AcrR family transcriptional regulator